VGQRFISRGHCPESVPRRDAVSGHDAGACHAGWNLGLQDFFLLIFARGLSEICEHLHQVLDNGHVALGLQVGI